MLSHQIQSVQDAQKSIRHAQKLLLKQNLNTQYAVVSYLRLCCLAIVRLRSVGIDHAPQLDAKRPYLALLKALYQHEPLWWKTCATSPEGTPVSSNQWVDRQLDVVRCSSRQILLETEYQSYDSITLHIYAHRHSDSINQSI